MKNLARLALLLLALALPLAGCQPQKFATAQQEATAKGYLEQLRQHRFDAINEATDATLRDTLPPLLAKMADLIPPGDARSVVLVGDTHQVSPDSAMVNLTYEYDYGGRYIAANVAMRTRQGVSTIVGMNVYPLAQALEAQHRFGFGGHAPIAYLVLASAILMPLVSAFALVVCIRTRLKGRKWPWIVFILFGFCTVQVNWANDAWAFQPLSFQLFSASAFSASAYAPWIIGVSVPLGAILFLAWRHELKARPPTEAVPAKAGIEATA